MKNKLSFLVLILFCKTLVLAEELESLLIVGTQESYFEESSSTSMKGYFEDKETPFSTSVTKGTLIEDLQAQRVEDTYDYTTGVTKAGNTADSLVIRGFDIDLQNVQVNGMAGLISRFGSPSTANVERIEVLKGPASILYGGMEPGGLVNIQTKLPQKDSKITFETSIQSYMANTSKFGDDLGITGTLDATGAVSNNSDLYYRFILVGENINTYRDNVNHKNIYLYPSILWNIDDDTTFSAALEYGKEKGSADNGLFVANHDISTAAAINTIYQEKNDFDNDTGTALDLNFDHFINDSTSFNFKLRSVLHEDERKLYENRKVNQSALISDTSLTRRNRHQLNKRDWHSFDTNLNYETNTASITHNILLGLAGSYRVTDYDRKAFGNNVDSDINIYNPVYGDTASTKVTNRRETEYYSSNIYLQDKIGLTDKLTIVAAGRVDKTKVDFTCVRGSCADDNSKESTDFVGSIGMVYNLNEIVSLYGSYGQSYDPSTAERVDALGNGLDSEKSEQSEVGAKININSEFNTGLAVYKINKRNVAEKDSSGFYELKGEVESKGFEADIQWLPTKNWQFKSGFAYNKSEYVAGSSIGDNPSNTPKITSYIFTRYNIPKKVFNGTLGFSAGLVYRDEIYTSSSESKRVELPSYSRVDLGAYYSLQNLDLSFNIENLANKEYFESGTEDYRIYSGEPRKITFNIKKTF